MPPKKQKKQPKNPFFFFMMDWKKDQIEMGNAVPGALNLLAEAATPAWKSLPEPDKEYYKEKARVAKEDDKHNLNNKFTTEGKSYAQLYREQQEVQDFVSQMNQEITETVNSISQNRQSLLNHRFYFIHANHYCYWSNKGIYIPCEVAIAEYSIAHGVISTLHFFPAVIATEEGRLPLGYLHEAQEIARRTHCVALPPKDDAQDYDIIAARVVSFLQRNGSSRLPPLYTQEDNVNCNNSMSTVKDFLKNCEDFCDAQFRTYNLTLLFNELRNACADFSVREGIDEEATGFPTWTLAQVELDRDIFHFTRGISCEYHEDLSRNDDEHCVSQYCSLSTVTRWGFLISDYCCKDVGVQLIRGKHCPLNADVSYSTKCNETNGWSTPGPSGENKKKFVDAPPPAVNSWGKGPPKMNSKVQEVKEDSRSSKPVETKVKNPEEKPSSESSWRPNTTGNTTAEPEQASADHDDGFDDFPGLDGFRLPRTRGRGERLLAAINRIQLDTNNDDFPALGAGRGRGKF